MALKGLDDLQRILPRAQQECFRAMRQEGADAPISALAEAMSVSYEVAKKRRQRMIKRLREDSEGSAGMN